jgi:hypothetical protein
METSAKRTPGLKQMRLIMISFGVIASCTLSLCPNLALSAARKEKNSARAGDLQFLVSSVEFPETVGPSGMARPNRATAGYHFVVVHVKVKNMGKLAACAYFTARLKARFDIVYRRVLAFEEQVPHIHELLPGEEADGSYVFEVKDGVSPVELILGPMGKQGCGGESPGFYPGEVQIPLEGM